MVDFIKLIGTIVWGPHMLIFLLGIGIYFTIRLKFIQLFGFTDALKFLLSKYRLSSAGEKEKGDLTSYEALMTSLGGVVGNGNIAGVATAIAIGGPGAIFWMWISACSEWQILLRNRHLESITGVLEKMVVFWPAQCITLNMG